MAYFEVLAGGTEEVVRIPSECSWRPSRVFELATS
jgi:hypothetical protein